MKPKSLLIRDRGRLRVEYIEIFREYPAREETCCHDVLGHNKEQILNMNHIRAF